MKINKLIFVLFLSLAQSNDDMMKMFVPQGQPFSFDCQDDESVYFGKTVDDWSELQDGDMNLKFQYVSKENLLRVRSEAATPDQIGFYGCRKATWSSTTMNVIHQLISSGNYLTRIIFIRTDRFLFSDVQMFYWNFICHGPLGGCERTDDYFDRQKSSFQVADQVEVEFFCCASAVGHDHLDIQMNPVGFFRSKIDVDQKQQADGSIAICAHQKTRFQHSIYQKLEYLNCQLLADQRALSKISISIMINGFSSSFVREIENLFFSFRTGHFAEISSSSLATAHCTECKHVLSWSRSGKIASEIFHRFVSTVQIDGTETKSIVSGRNIAIILGSIVSVMLIIGLVLFLWCRRRRLQNKTKSKSWRR